MKRVLTLLILLFGLSYLAQSQIIISSDFESWSGNVPAGWVGTKTTFSADSIQLYTTNVHGGASACQLINQTSSHKRFTSQPTSLTTGDIYTITFWVRGHGDIRTGLYDGRATGSGYATYNPYISVNSNTWSMQQQQITCANTTAAGEFIFSIRNTNSDIDHLQIDDVIISIGQPTTNPMINITYPANNAINYSPSISVIFNTANFTIGNPGGTGVTGHLHYTIDGGAAQMQYSSAPVIITGMTAGNHAIILQLVDNSHNPLTPNVADTVNITVDLTPQNPQTIHDIQFNANADTSAFSGQVVTTTGIVTGTHSAGYFIQDGTGPWTGLYVFDNINKPSLGDAVTVTGKVKEYYTFTELNLVNGFNINSIGNPLPAPAALNAASMNTEQYESVLVKLLGAQCVNTNAGFGMWKVQDATDTAKVHNLLFTFTPVLNTYYNITGPLYYSFNEFKIEPRDANDIQVVTGIDPINAQFIPSLYPNPASDQIVVTNAQMFQSFTIMNIAGQVVYNLDKPGDSFNVDVTSLSPGIYIARFAGNGNPVTIRFTKK